jgi:hypothetical protein
MIENAPAPRSRQTTALISLCVAHRRNSSFRPVRNLDIAWFRADDRGSASGFRRDAPDGRILRRSLLAAVADTSKRRIGDRRRTAANKAAQLPAFSSRTAGWTARAALSPCVVKTTCNLRRWR